MAVDVSVKKLRYYWPVYLLVAIPLLLVLLFSYYPIYNGFIHIFYRWNGDTVEEFIGLGNIIRVLNDTTLLNSFGVVLIFVIANVVKMILPIITAVILHDDDPHFSELLEALKNASAWRKDFSPRKKGTPTALPPGYPFSTKFP